MLDHIGFPVADFERAKAFYTKALGPARLCAAEERRLERRDRTRGICRLWPRHGPQFWIGTGAALQGRLHVAFAAKDRACVRAFYEAAIAAGGRDNGSPGLRPHYHENYYGAFVIDPDGHNIEAVTHISERA